MVLLDNFIYNILPVQGVTDLVYQYTASEIISDMNTEIAMSQRPLEKVEDKEELALQVGDKYLAIQKCDDGYDYTFYDAAFHGLDGGAVENKDAPIAIVAAEVIAAEGLSSVKPVKEVDYDKIQEDAAYTVAYEEVPWKPIS